MNNRQHSARTLGRALPALVLAVLAAALVLSTGAVAEPIVIVPPTEVGGTGVSGSVDSDPQANACVGDQHSGADPADPNPVQVNDTSCTSGSGAGAGTGSSGSGTGAGAGTRPSSSTTTRGSAGTTKGAGASAATVAAADAVGLRIAGVRKLMKKVKLTRNFRLLVTIRDGRGLLVRGAIVSAGRVPGSTSTLKGLHAGFSNKRGVATILVPVTTRMFGKRLYVKIAARTPKARAVALRSVALPRLR